MVVLCRLGVFAFLGAAAVTFIAAPPALGAAMPAPAWSLATSMFALGDASTGPGLPQLPAAPTPVDETPAPAAGAAVAAPSVGSTPAAPTPPNTGGGGDAEPAPAEPGAPATGAGGADSSPRFARHRIAVSPRFAYRLGDAGSAVSPAAGYGIAGTYEFTYALVMPALELALGIDFSSDRFAAAEQGIGPGLATYSSTRVIEESAFILTHTVAVRFGPVRPFFTLGAGLGIGDLQSVAQAYAPGTLRDTQLLGRGSIGLDVVVGRVWSVSLRGDYTAVRRTDRLITNSGQALPIFGDMLDVNLGLVYRF